MLAARCLMLGLLAVVAPDGIANDAVPASPVTVDVRLLSDVASRGLRRLPAQVLPRNEAWLSAEAALTVASIKADVGDSVAQGDVLLVWEDRDLRLRWQQAQAQSAAASAKLELAVQRLERGKSLQAQRHISADDLLDLQTLHIAARAERDAAQAGEQLAKRLLDKTVLRAPFDAVVLERRAQVGQLSAPGEPMLRVAEAGHAQVAVNIPAGDRARVFGARAWHFEDAQGARHALAAPRISPVIDRQTQAYPSRFENSEGDLPSGASGDLVAELAAFEVPSDYAVERDGRVGLMIAVDGEARFIGVEGAQGGRHLLVDLPADTSIIVRGHQSLRNGESLRPVAEH